MATNFKFHEEYEHVEVNASGRKVALQNEEKYGVAIYVEGHEEAVAFIDFFYLDCPDCSDYHRERAPQIVIYDTAEPLGDPVGFIKLETAGTRVAFENGVEVVENDEQYGEMYGYLSS